jgi:hypothetical protein
MKTFPKMNTIAISPDLRYLASSQRYSYVFDYATGEKKWFQRISAIWVEGLRFSADSNTLLINDYKGNLHRFESSSGKLVESIRTGVQGNRFLFNRDDTAYLTWRKNGSLVCRRNDEEHEVFHCAFSDYPPPLDATAAFNDQCVQVDEFLEDLSPESRSLLHHVIEGPFSDTSSVRTTTWPRNTKSITYIPEANAYIVLDKNGLYRYSCEQKLIQKTQFNDDRPWFCILDLQEDLVLVKSESTLQIVRISDFQILHQTTWACPTLQIYPLRIDNAPYYLLQDFGECYIAELSELMNPDTFIAIAERSISRNNERVYLG